MHTITQQWFNDDDNEFREILDFVCRQHQEEERRKQWDNNLRRDLLWAGKYVYFDENGEIDSRIIRKRSGEYVGYMVRKQKEQGVSPRTDEFGNPLPYTTWDDPHIQVTRQYHVLRDLFLPEIEEPGLMKKRKPYTRKE